MKNILKSLGGLIMKSFSYVVSSIISLAGLLRRYDSDRKPIYSSTAFQPCGKSIRNPKDPHKVAIIQKRRKATKLSKLSKPKRRAIYYYNLRHPVKMYA
jgi:hypothetical protein